MLCQFPTFLHAIVPILNCVPRDREVNRDFAQLEDSSVQR